MPTYGEKQKPAGVVLQKEKPVIGKRAMYYNFVYTSHFFLSLCHLLTV